MSLVKVEELSYTYPYAREAALKKVNLKIDRGEFILLLGPSGCGKSTLAMTLNGVIPHEMGGEVRGSVQVCGMNTQDYRVSDFARKVGIVFQNPDAQIIHSRVEDEVTFPMQNLLVPPGEMQRRRDEVLGIVGLTAQRRSLVHTLSGGQKQRLAIAAALSMNPELLILDEPTAHLDPKGTKEVMSTVEKLNREGNITVVLIEHKLDEITKYADRIAIMNQGTM
ncbi:MAG: ABC transporter ATP-binding protein, partial [Thaumarchaeota archaeon]